MSAPRVALAETCRIVGGEIPLWPYHRARLAAAGCDERMLRETDREVRDAARRFCRARPGQRFRLSLVVWPADRDLRVTVIRRLSSLDVPNGPVVARVDATEPPTLPPGPAKPADRSYWDEAHRRAKAVGAHQAILVARDGTVVDGSTATVWIAEKGVLVTPPSPPAVPGVGRAMVLANAERARLDVRVEAVTWERFEAADEAFLTNAFGGAAPVRMGTSDACGAAAPVRMGTCRDGGAARGGPLFERVAALFAEAWGRT